MPKSFNRHEPDTYRQSWDLASTDPSRYRLVVERQRNGKWHVQIERHDVVTALWFTVGPRVVAKNITEALDAAEKFWNTYQDTTLLEALRV